MSITDKKKSKPKTNNRKKKIKWTEEMFMETILQPLAEGATLNDIAKSLNLTRQSINLRLQAYGIQNKTEAMQYIIQRAKNGSAI